MEQTKLEELIEQIDQLPTLPTTVIKLVQMVQDPDTSAQDVNQVLAQDPSLAARILRMVNSAYFGFSERITSIRHAIVIMGFHAVKNLALTASVLDSFESDGFSTDVFDRKQFWVHSLSVAAASKLVAKQMGYPNPDEHFISGLLHDIGKIVIDQKAHDGFVEVLKLVEDQNILIREAEMKVFGFDHTQVGRWLAKHWNLPEELHHVIAFHHEPPRARDQMRAVTVVHIADVLARALFLGTGGDRLVPMIDEEAWEASGLSLDDIEIIMPKLITDSEELSSFLE